MQDELFDGRRLWVLTVVDTWSRICPVMRVCRSATAMEVIDALEQARRQHGLPTTIRVDQGSQFTSKELDLWAYANGITLDFSRRGNLQTTRMLKASMQPYDLNASAGTGSWIWTMRVRKWKNGASSTTKCDPIAQLVTGRRCP